MHPYDAKSNFLSEMDVLSNPQRKRPSAAVFHVILVCHVWVLVWVLGSVLFLSPQNACFCACMCITFVYVFCSIYSNSYFRMHFYQCFCMLPLAASWLLVVGLRQSGESVGTECLFR